MRQALKTTYASARDTYSAWAGKGGTKRIFRVKATLDQAIDTGTLKILRVDSRRRRRRYTTHTRKARLLPLPNPKLLTTGTNALLLIHLVHDDDTLVCSAVLVTSRPTLLD